MSNGSEDIQIQVKLALEQLQQSVATGRAELEKLNTKVRIDLEEDRIKTQIQALRARFAELSNQKVTPQIELEKESVIKGIAQLQGQLKGILFKPIAKIFIAALWSRSSVVPH
jgi:hypothetical protein